MRQGNRFTQRLDKDKYGLFTRVPLELVEELYDYTSIVWVSNSDGTYTLIPSDKDGRN